MNEQGSSPYPMPDAAPASNALRLLGRNASNSATIPSAATLPQNIFTNPAVQPSSVINLSNSTDVVIGPMTQYQGPVTIYQYMDATVEARAMHAGGGIRQNNTTNNSTTLLQKLSRNGAVLFVLVIIIIVSVGVTVYLALGNKDNDSNKTPRQILFGNQYETGTFPNLGNGHLVIDREQWGASEDHPFYPLEHPIPYVLITHIGVQASPCYNVYKCSIRMRNYQDAAIVEKNFTDINSNFYLGHDGNIYVGRGWDRANGYANKSLAVTLIGDFQRYEPNDKIIEGVQYLLAYALTNKYLALDYKLIAQNQTGKTKSPGVPVYREIIKWPHWYPCSTESPPYCGAEIGLPKYWNATQ